MSALGRVGIGALALGLFTSILSAQDLQPDQILILGNRESLHSARLAHDYAKARNIPARNILLLNLPLREDITRSVYDQRIAQPIRSFLHQLKLENKIRVLVTLYGMPLKVGPAEPTAEQRDRARFVRDRYRNTFAKMELGFAQLEKLAGVAATQPTRLPGGSNVADFLPKAPALYTRVQEMYARMNPRIREKTDKVEQQMLLNQFIQLRLLFEGQSILAVAQNPPNPEVVERLKSLDQELSSLTAVVPEKRDLEQTYQKAQAFGGWFLELRTMYEDYDRLTEKNSSAAVDSELSLVLWDEYSLAGRLPNGLNPRFANHPLIRSKGPILMVARLDGPDPSTVERIIRDSLAAEAGGLTQGTFYLDARGIMAAKDGYFEYDDNLRRLAEGLQKDTKLPVVLDNRPPVFAPNTCPNTRLYCGWYSLKNYVPAFTFLTGSVGYHIASFEATTLRRHQNNEWVQRMLQAGIAATVGPVDEPYLDAFPLPTEFFGLLLTGKYPLVEVYYRTLRYNSWRMILIGDPLYKPFAKNPILKEEAVPLKPLNLLLFN